MSRRLPLSRVCLAVLQTSRTWDPLALMIRWQFARELMALTRAGNIKPTPMKEEPMADVQKWIEELRAGKVVGRIVLKN